jgi:hypothetical protein
VSTDLKTFGEAGLNFDMTPFQMLGVIRFRLSFDDEIGKLLLHRTPPARLSLNDYPFLSVHLFLKRTLPDVPT